MTSNIPGSGVDMNPLLTSPLLAEAKEISKSSNEDIIDLRNRLEKIGVNTNNGNNILPITDALAEGFKDIDLFGYSDGFKDLENKRTGAVNVFNKGVRNALGENSFSAEADQELTNVTPTVQDLGHEQWSNRANTIKNLVTAVQGVIDHPEIYPEMAQKTISFFMGGNTDLLDQSNITKIASLMDIDKWGIEGTVDFGKEIPINEGYSMTGLAQNLFNKIQELKEQGRLYNQPANGGQQGIVDPLPPVM